MKYLKLKFLLIFAALAMAIPPAWAETVTDVLNQEFTGITGTSYDTWSGKTGTSGAVYTGNSAGGNSSIQLRSKNGSGIVTTKSGGKVKSVTVEWESNTADNRVLQVYCNNSAYSLAEFANGTKGTLVGTIVKGTSTTLNIEGDYSYIGLCSADGAMYLTSISIVWDPEGGGGGDDPEPPTPSEGKLYEKVVDASQIVAGKKVIFVYEGTSALAMGTSFSSGKYAGTSVTIDNGVVDIENKDVLEVTVGDGNVVYGSDIKQYTLALPSGNQYLDWTGSGANFKNSDDAVDWRLFEYTENGNSLGFTFKYANASRYIRKNSSNSNFAPYDNTAQSVQAYLYVEKDNGSTVERVATPTFSPAGGSYDEALSVTISCETDGATIYYTTDGSTPDNTSTPYTGAIAVNETTTIKAIAVADDMEDSYVATATYTLPTFVSNFAAANGLPDNTNFTYTKKAVVVYVKGSNMWIQDVNATAGGGYVYTAGLDFAANDVIEANWKAKKETYKGFPEFTGFEGSKVEGDGNTQTPVILERTTINSDNFAEYVLLKNVTITEENSKLYANLPDSRQSVVLYTSKLGLEEDFKPVSGKTYNIKGIVGGYDVLQIYPLEISEYVAPGEPSINVEPTELILKEPATGTFNVTGENLIDNVGCPNENHVFNTTYTGGEIWGFNQDANHEVNGTVTVTYTGRELTATDIFYAGTKKSWNPQVEISIPVTVTYQPDIWLYGNFGDGNWVYGNKMEYSDGIYSVNFTTTAETFLLFAKKADETYNWDTNRLFFGPKTDGDNWLLNSIFEDDLDLNGIKNKNNDNVQYHPIQLPIAGEYTITINPTTKRFTISRVVQQVAKPVIAPEGGEYNTIQTVTITCETEGAVIHYTTDGTVPDANSPVYSDVITVDHTMTIKAIAVADGMDNSEMASETYTLPTSVNTLAAANALEAGTEFLFTGDVVVTYANGDYIWLRDKDATAGGGLFYQTNLNLTQGAVLNKGWSAKRQDYRGEKEFINAANVTNSGNTASFAPFDRTGSPLDVANMNEYIKLDNVKITGKTLDQQSNKYTYTGQYGSESKDVVNYILHNQFGLTGIEEGKTYNVVGTVIQYDDVTEVYPTEVTPVQVDPGLAFSEETVNTTFGAAFTAPELTKPDDLTVTYESSNTNVATVDQNTGAVTIVGVGNAKITASSTETTYYLPGEASYTIVVAAATPTFAYSAETATATFGETAVLPTLNNPNGLTVSYESTNTAVATVANDGVVTIAGAGTTVIKATGAATGNYSGAEAQYTLTVNKADLEVSFDNETPDPITIGDDFIAPTLSEVPEGVTVTYTSNNTDVATVDQNGNVTIVGVGSAKITATITGDNYNETSVSYTITVNDVVEAIAAPTFSPAAGTYTEPKEVAIACATPGVTIKYTIDGETKTYEGPFTVDHDCTVSAMATMGTRTVYTPATNEATYTINAVPAANVADDYYYLQSKAAEVSGKYTNVAGRRTLNFVADADKQAGTVFRIKTDPDTVGQVETLRSQAVDLQGYANRAMAYVPKAIDLVLSTLANSSLGDPETPGDGILGENGVDLILKKFYEKFDYNLYIEQAEGGYRIYGKTPSMQHVVDFYHENTAQVEEKLPMLESYINQVLAKIRAKIPAPYDANVVIPFSLKAVRDRIADKYGITLIDPTVDEMGFYRQVLNNKEYVWDFAYQTAMMYVDVIKQTGTYESLPAEYKLYVEKMEKVRPDTKYYIIERGNELDYISENNTEIINNDPRTLWSLTKRENFTVNVPEANKLNDSYYTTLYTDFAYSLPEDVKAYAVTGIDANDVAQLTEITGTIPAQTPVLLKATAAGDKELTLKMDSRGGAVEGNLLEGPDYLVKTYGITSPTVVGLFNMAAGFVPAETLAEYEYLKLRTSGTVNNKYFWSVNDALDSCTYKDANNENDCVVRSLAVKNGTLAFSEHWTTENNKAFLVGDVNKPVIYLEKETLAEPTFSPVPGSYTVDNGENVTITITAEDDATIYYKIGDGEYQPYEGPITASDDMTIVAKAVKDGMIASNEVTAVYVIDNPTVLPDVPAMKGYYQIKNNGNNKYANVAGRKTLNFKSEDEAKTEAGTVIWLETNGKGQVQSIRSQAADLQRYADRAMTYVPDIVEIVADKLNADGVGNLLGHEGLEKIMDKFNKSFDHHLYVEQAEGGYRLYGKTPSMQPVVEFYRENQAKVEAKLPMLEQFINDALDKLKERLGGSSVFTPFSLHDIWQKMGGTLTEPTDDASTMAFYREVLNNKNYVWDFAYQTAMIYVNNLKQNQHWSEVETALGEYAQYIDMIEQVHPEFKYYIVQKDGKPDFISQGNTDIINNAARTIWTLEDRTTFNVNIDENNLFGCPLAGGVGGYATTLYTDFAYELPDNVDDVDVTAYKVTSIEGGKATIEALSGIIPAQTPVLLTAKVAGTVTLKLTTEPATADTTGNLLRGPDYLINVYDLKTDQVQSLFDQIKQKLGQDFYDTYVAQYEYLADLNSGTVNNKYFWGLKESDVEKCSNDGGENCVVRNLSGDKFIDNWKVETNKAFLVTDEYAEITFNTLHGDVNHDGLVNIEDVTDLIDRLLGMPDAYHLKACEYCSDVNKNGTVKIDDVTTLIDILLGIDGSNQATDPQGGE